MTTNVSVLGAAGFIGSAVVTALAREQTEPSVRLLVRTPNAQSVQKATNVHVGDVRHKGSLRVAVRGADTVVHCASYIGYDAELCETINVTGTRNVVEACTTEGVGRVIYMSTAAVYRAGPRRGETEAELSVDPSSTLSRSRAAAEEIVLEAGGVVIRPDMVVGRGDRWVVPALHRFTAAVGGLVNGGSTLMSMIHVKDLGAVAAQIALQNGEIAGVFNAAYSEPVAVRALVGQLPMLPAFAGAVQSVSRDVARERAIAGGFSQHQFDLLTADHWFSNERLRRLTGQQWDGGPELTSVDRAWYQSALLTAWS